MKIFKHLRINPIPNPNQMKTSLFEGRLKTFAVYYDTESYIYIGKIIGTASKTIVSKITCEGVFNFTDLILILFCDLHERHIF